MDNQPNIILLDGEENRIFNGLLHHIMAGNLVLLEEVLEAMDPIIKSRILLGINHEDNSLLNLAVLSEDNLAMCQILVRHGARVDNRDGHGNRPIDLLHFAEHQLPINNRDEIFAWLAEAHLELPPPRAVHIRNEGIEISEERNADGKREQTNAALLPNKNLRER